METNFCNLRFEKSPPPYQKYRNNGCAENEPGRYLRRYRLCDGEHQLHRLRGGLQNRQGDQADRQQAL